LPATFNLDGPIQYKESKYEEAVAPNAEGFQEKSEDELSKIRQHDIDEFLKSDSIMNEEDLTRLVSQLINQYYYLSHIWKPYDWANYFKPESNKYINDEL